MELHRLYTYEQFIQTLNTEEYKISSNKSRTNYPEFEKLRKFGENVHSIFSDLLKQNQRIPTQAEYINEGLKRAEIFFTNRLKDGKRWLAIDKDLNGKPVWHGFDWEDTKLKQAVIIRLARSYPSYIVELQVQLFYITHYSDELLVGENDNIDFVMAVDLVLGVKALDRMLFYHITNRNSMDYIHLKEAREVRNNNKDEGYKRDFTNHLYLLYDRQESESTKIENGNVLLKESYLVEELKKGLQMLTNSQHAQGNTIAEPNILTDLDSWMLRNRNKPLGEVWLNS